jgi:hypothetical protein
VLTAIILPFMLAWGRGASRLDWKPFAAMAMIAALETLFVMLVIGEISAFLLIAAWVGSYIFLLAFFLQGRALRRWLDRNQSRHAGRVEIDQALLATLAENRERDRL